MEGSIYIFFPFFNTKTITLSLWELATLASPNWLITESEG